MRFSKMHGLGNDFMVVDMVTQICPTHFSPNLIRDLADRHRGVGFDQLLLVEPPYSPETDFHYRVFNSDGNEVSQCGNGARCIARFLHIKGLTGKKEIVVSTVKGSIRLTMKSSGVVRVNMGEPMFSPQDVPLLAEKTSKSYLLQTSEGSITYSAVSVGNPHCIVQVKDISTAPVESLGSFLEDHENFPERTNVGFMEVVDSKYIRLRVHERGVGETQACGSGACAAVACGIQQGILASTVKVDLPGGTLSVTWKGKGYPLFMMGPAIHIYDGYIEL